jgi:hypothetical protein
MDGRFRNIRVAAPVLIGLVLLAISQAVAAQEAPPQETKGLRPSIPKTS